MNESSVDEGCMNLGKKQWLFDDFRLPEVDTTKGKCVGILS
jgi:hypothetical protein